MTGNAPHIGEKGLVLALLSQGSVNLEICTVLVGYSFALIILIATFSILQKGVKMSHGNGHGMTMPMGNTTNTTSSPTTMSHGEHGGHGMTGGHGMMVSWLQLLENSKPIATKLT